MRCTVVHTSRRRGGEAGLWLVRLTWGPSSSVWMTMALFGLFGVVSGNSLGKPPELPPRPERCGEAYPKLIGGECDDGNPCTHDICVDTYCQHTDLTGWACDDDDGNPCTEGLCDAGMCVAEPVSGTPCDEGDEDPCTEGVCDAGMCVAEPVSGPACDDGDDDPCTEGICDEGVCLPEPASGQPCEDGDEDPCTEGICDTGMCIPEPASGASCEDGDGNPCTEGTCDTGACTPQAISGPACDDGDGNPCTEGVCDEGTCVAEPLSGGSCDDGDGDPCTEGICDEGTCVAEPLSGGSCDDGDGDPCTEGVCDEGVCSPQPVSGPACDNGDENPCTEGICDEGACVAEPLSGGSCDDGDGNPCTEGVCDAGTCVPELLTGPSCDDDGNPCTIDQCENGVCAHLPNSGASCEDDGNPCTDDVCVGATCSHEASTGQPCESDGDPCTEDVCVNGTCSHEPISGPPCESDGNPCTNDVCENGACAHVPLTGPTCTDDGNVCTFDVCENGTCSHPAHDGVACPDDGNVCTYDECQNKVCSHPAHDGVACADDGNPCTGDVCSGGSCTHPGISGPACDDGDSCTEEDTCVNGTCVGTQYRDCDDQNPCTDDDCVGDGCVHTNNTAPCDNGNACTEDDTCAGGTCQAGTPIDCDDGNLCSTELGCDPDEGCLYDWDNCDDGDPCTYDICDPETGECEHMEMWGQLQPACSDIGCHPSMSAPPWIIANDDDDNGNGVKDRDDAGPIAGEDDIIWVPFATPGCSPAEDCELLIVRWHLAAYAGCGGWAFSSADGDSSDIDLYGFWPPPTGFFLEGVIPGNRGACGCAAEFSIGANCCRLYLEPIPVVAVVSLEWQKAAAGNFDIDDCPTNGGKRIFPGKVSQDDPLLDVRRRVKLVATVRPPIAGIPVHFKVWDVDDPFDDLHTPYGPDDIADYSLVDGDTSGPDNRPAAEAPQTATANTDENGLAIVTIIVSMQPGNNYRAGASCLADAIDQADQAKADALNEEGGDWSGYSVPLVWSEMLTVWRKLRVELDSMGPVTGNSVTGTILEVIDLDPIPKVKFRIPDLHEDFEEDDHFKYGEMTIVGYGGTFTTCATAVGTGSDYVTIQNPDGVDFSAAVGAAFTLFDDDIGLPGFLPGLVFPRLPDTHMMYDVYGEAYVGIELVDQPPESETNLAFIRNLEDQDAAYAVINNSKDVQSSEAYWAAHVVAAFQGHYRGRDGDPDTEEETATDGLLYGATKVIWLLGNKYGGSLVFLETCRDKSSGGVQYFWLLERFNVAHEVGHQFKLEHEDGVVESPEYRTYLMMVSKENPIPDNLWFSPTSLNKIRNIDWPQKE